jgi:fucose 4-O-acetylase-like acetyltransferase
MTILAKNTRYIAFDNLRGTMMLLMVLLHASLPYVTIRGIQTFADPSKNIAFDALALFLYSFLIPLFFITSGFCAGSLCNRRGLRNMIRDRCLRIALPLVVGWFLLEPLTRSALLFADATSCCSVARGLQVLGQADWLAWRGAFYHLWFLAALLVFYTFGLVLRWLILHLGPMRFNQLVLTARSFLASPWRTVVTVAIFGCISMV